MFLPVRALINVEILTPPPNHPSPAKSKNSKKTEVRSPVSLEYGGAELSVHQFRSSDCYPLGFRVQGLGSSPENPEPANPEPTSLGFGV